jgi:hypothetical protein
LCSSVFLFGFFYFTRTPPRPSHTASSILSLPSSFALSLAANFESFDSNELPFAVIGVDTDDEEEGVDVNLLLPLLMSLSTFACVSFPICFVLNYFMGKKQNEVIALAWATKFATGEPLRVGVCVSVMPGGGAHGQGRGRRGALCQCVGVRVHR